MDIEAFLSALTGTGIVALVFGFWMKNYFGPYLKVKATNLATHEDIQLLINQVRETERVKAEISDRVWDRQQRWAFKQDIYRQVLETIAKIYEAQVFVLHDQEERKRGKATSPEDVVRVSDVLSSLRDLHHLATIAAVVIDPDAYRIVREVVDKDDVEGQAEIDFLDRALERLTVVARRDLGYVEKA